MTAEVDLFVYGTLMDESTLYDLTRRHFPIQPAELPGFERILPPRGYPYIIPNPGARTSGLLLCGVDQATLAVLDRYEDEGNLYHRRQVEVTVGGQCVSCETYVGDVEALKAYCGGYELSS